MPDSSTSRRSVLAAGVLAGSTFALVAVAGPASAAGLVPPLPPAPTLPAAVPTCGPAVLSNCYLPGTKTLVRVYVPTAPKLPPPPAPGSSAVGAATAPLQAPASQLQSAAGGAAGLPSTPGASSTGGSTAGPSGSTPTRAPATAKAPGATPDNLLGAASAFLPSSLFTTVADLGSTPGSLESVPLPDLAALPESRLLDVQAPLLAAAQQSAGGSFWQAVSGKVLPGLLIVLATVVVGLVGAGNIRVWQLRMAARNS